MYQEVLVVKLLLLCVIAGLCVACIPSEDDIRTDVRAQLAADPTTAAVGPVGLSRKPRRLPLRKDRYQGGAAAGGGNSPVGQGREARGERHVVNNVELADKVKAALAADAMVGKVPIEVDANGGFGPVNERSDQPGRTHAHRRNHFEVEGVEQVEDRMK